MDLASKLLPARTRLKPGILLHMHIHASMISKQGDRQSSGQVRKDGGTDSVPSLIDSLHHLIQGLKPPMPKTEWADYYSDTNYSHEAFASKQDIVREFLASIGPQAVCDLGANDGTFSRIASQYAKYVVSADIDPIAVENNYRALYRNAKSNIIPVLIDLTNPT